MPSPIAGPSRTHKGDKAAVISKQAIGDVTSTDDFTIDVILAAIKRFELQEDAWQRYVLFIASGPPDKRSERCLTIAERPVERFRRLQAAGKDPVFLLKHVEDVPSPLSSFGRTHTEHLSDSTTPTTPLPEEVVNRYSGSENATCIAIYPYLAREHDEFDVSFGDAFAVVTKSASGWWKVQRATAPDTAPGEESQESRGDATRHCWVPGGCLLETRIHLSEAIANAVAKGGVSLSRAPILPDDITSTSREGIALADYRKGDVHEVDIEVRDAIRIYKRYHHWSYIAREVDGDRGWVPSWIVDKAAKLSESIGGRQKSML